MAGGGGNNGGGIPPASRKMVQSLKEIVNGVTEGEIYSTLKECNMDPNEAVNRLLSQDTFHEVKSKREKKKEFKDTTESRPRGGGGGSTSNRGARSGTDRYAGRVGSTHFNSSESGGLYGKPTQKRENSASFSTSSTTPAPRVAPRNANWHPTSYSDSLGLKNETPSFTTVDSVSVAQPSSGYQSAWLGAPGQKSMAEIVKMGRPQNKSFTTSNPSQPSVSHNFVPEYDVSPNNEWPSMEPPQAVTVVDTHAESGVNSGQSNLSIDRNNEFKEYENETNEAEVQDESSSEEQIDTHGPTSVNEPELLYADGTYDNIDSYQPHDDGFEREEEEEEEEAEEEEEEEEEEYVRYNMDELTEPGDRIVVACGGEGGLGNVFLSQNFNKNYSHKKRIEIGKSNDTEVQEEEEEDIENSSLRLGCRGAESVLILELKSIADVGLVGMPNAGKSTLLGALSKAQPRIGHYAFTTLRPNLGNLTFDDLSVTVADIPGLIKGAHENRGLGHAFLRHIERTKVLAYVLDLAAGLDGRKGVPPWEQLKDLISELEFYNAGLSGRPSLIVANKIDEDGAEEVYDELKRRVSGVKIFPVCAVLGEGVTELKDGLRMLVSGEDSNRLTLDDIHVD